MSARLPLRTTAFALTSVLALLCVAAVYITLDAVTDELVEQDRQSIADRRDLRERLAQHEEVNDALAEQVKALGGHPVADPDPASPTTYIPIPGEDGRNGRDAKPPTLADLAAAVAAYCAEVDCRGPAGEDSTVPGPTGPAGKDGRDGEDSTVPGPTGPAGKDGRGIASISCSDSGDWIIGFTDGTTQTVSGPCRVLTAPPSTD